VKRIFILQVRFSDEELDRLDKLARARQMTRSQAVRMAIRLALSLFVNPALPVGLPSEVNRDAVSMDVDKL
jgi:hypothetical protein